VLPPVLPRDLAEPGLVIVCAVVDDALSPDVPLGDSLEVFVRRDDAEQLTEDVRGNTPELTGRYGIAVPVNVSRPFVSLPGS